MDPVLERGFAAMFHDLPPTVVRQAREALEQIDLEQMMTLGDDEIFWILQNKLESIRLRDLGSQKKATNRAAPGDFVKISPHMTIKKSGEPVRDAAQPKVASQNDA
jgi:hypothetical protein